MGTLDRLITEAQTGQPAAREALVAELMDQLRAMASAFLRHERPGHTLRTTDLVNEVYIRLHESRNLDTADDKVFLAAAATAMRRVLIDHGRGHNAQKRGGRLQRVTLTDAEGIVPETEYDTEKLGEALQELEQEHPRPFQVVMMKLKGGPNLTTKRLAQLLGVSERTVELDHKLAHAWLRKRLSPQ